MEEYIYEVNTKQLEARREVGRYITDLETQLATLKSAQQHQKGVGHLWDLNSKPKHRNLSFPGSWITQSTLAHDQSSDSTLSCGSADASGNIDMAHAQSDVELSDASSKPKGRRRTLPLTPSDIEALSDEGVMVGEKTGKVFLRRGKCLPRRLTKDSGLGESLVGIGTNIGKGTGHKSAYPWRRNGM